MVASSPSCGSVHRDPGVSISLVWGNEVEIGWSGFYPSPQTSAAPHLDLLPKNKGNTKIKFLGESITGPILALSSPYLGFTGPTACCNSCSYPLQSIGSGNFTYGSKSGY